MITELKEVYEKYLQMCIADISAFTNEADIWKIAPGISNSAGNLALHIAGNLNLFVGNILGNTGYIRDRDAEFNSKDIPQQQLIQLLESTSAMMNRVLGNLSDEQLQQPYPIDKFGADKTNAFALTYLLAHLAYHQGQVNYHRRLLNK
jgi:uncharacterized damage-inducible protein DinB